MSEEKRIPHTTGRWILRSLLLVVSATLALLAAEFLVRTIYPEYGVPVQKVRVFTEFDPLLGWRKIPDFRGVYEQREYTAATRINSKGLRGPEYAYAKASNAYRILVLGDSFAEGYSAEFEDLFSEVMRKLLNREVECTVEVINGGTGGYSTDQELLFFQTEGRKYQPDLTILLFYHNDLKYNLRSKYPLLDRGAKPLFTLEDGTLTLSTRPTPPASAERPSATNGGEVPFRIHDLNTWYLYRLCRHTLRVSASQHDMIAQSLTTEEFEEMMALDEPSVIVEAGNDESSPSDELRRQWEMAEALLVKLKEECATESSELILFFVPHRGDVYTRQDEIRDSKPPVLANLARVAERNEIDFINPLPLFRSKAAELIETEGRRLYWRRDAHWTPEGNQLVGHLLAKYVLKNRDRYRLCTSDLPVTR